MEACRLRFVIPAQAGIQKVCAYGAVFVAGATT
jgi:hypothetical protein